MGKINVLSFEIANLIAAGEVVERPASVLKELIENSMDSGADKIVAEIKRGGVSLIRVTDNGSGISKEDLPISIKRHATSKIKDKDDLSSIKTLGFRGEALAAISSVSELTIITKTKDAENASMLTAEAGRVVDISEVGAADGTTVVVENLFYNVPARRKFLKKDSTEAMNVSALVEKVALSRPDISIQLLVDGEERFKTPGNSDVLGAIRAIFGKDFASKMIEVNGISNGIKVSGYIGRSDNVKKNRNLENVFINSRYVKSGTAMAAIEKAFTSYIAPECFPTCVLYIEMSPAVVDVNVHPAKLEVKFSDERAVFESIYYTVKTALEGYEYRPEMTLSGKKTSERNLASAFVPIGENTKGEQISLKTERADYKGIDVAPKCDNGYVAQNNGFNNSVYNRNISLRSEPKNTAPMRAENKNGAMTPKSSIELLERYRTAKPKETEEEIKREVKPEVKIEIPEHKIIGEAFDCYVMVEYDGALLIVDKHAAHERVIFEDLKANCERDGRVASQTLLLPLTVILSPEEISAAEEYKEELSSVGFEYSVNGSAADITAIPNAVSVNDAENLFIKMTDEIISGAGKPEITEAIRREKALYQIACKAAIKGGRVYDRSVIEWLIAKVLLLPDITVCPHGRPIAYRLTKNELDRQFERIK